MKVKDLLPLIVIVSITLIIGGILFAAKITPEQTITNFNPMSEMSLKNDLRVLKTPTQGDNSFIYAINQVAARGLDIAQNDTTVNLLSKDQLSYFQYFIDKAAANNAVVYYVRTYHFPLNGILNTQ